MVNPGMCNCCREIWNEQNLKNVSLGKHKLHLCPDCYEEYTKSFNDILSELKSLKSDIVNESPKTILLSDAENIISYVEECIKTYS